MRQAPFLLILVLLLVAQQQAAAKNTLVFPQLGNGAGAGVAIRSEILLINNSRKEVTGTIEMFDDSGAPLALATNLGFGSSFQVRFRSGEQVLRLETDGLGDLKTGWARVTSDVRLGGAGSFTVSDSAGRFLSRVGVGNSEPAKALMVPVDMSEEKNTGFAVCNPDHEQEANIVLELRTMDGSVVASSPLSLPPGTHRARFIPEIFDEVDLTEFKGVLAVSGDAPVSLLTLRTRGVHFTSLPLAQADTDGRQGAEWVLPRIGDGLFADLEMETAFLLLNSSAQAANATVELFKEDGSEMGVRAGETSASRFAVVVPAGGTVELRTEGENRPGVIGWARIRSDRPIGAGAAFVITEQASGAFQAEVGVPGTAAVNRPMIEVRETGESSTGVALTNVTDEAVTVKLRLHIWPADWTSPPPPPGFVTERTLTLPPRGHSGMFIPELFANALRPGEGWVEVLSWVSRFGEDIQSPIAAMTLLSHGARLTSRPVAAYISTARPLSEWDSEVNQLLAAMTLDEKVGQMTQAERVALAGSESDVATYYLGSVLSGGGSGPAENRVEAWAEMYDRFQQQAFQTRLKIPIFYGIDAVHGHNNVRGAVIFPHNIGLGATRNPELVEKVARVTASEVRATGMNWTFSPCVAVSQDERWGRTYEGFSEDPELVRLMARAAVRGYQTEELDDPAAILACAKHYIGDGGTALGIDQGDARVDEATLRRIHLPGYLGAMEAGVGSIMVSFSSWNGVKLSAHKYLLTDVLKEELGFEGFLLSDWDAISQLPGDYRSKVQSSVNAGMDMFMMPNDFREFFNTLKNLVETGEVPMSRIDDAVRRILRVKFAAGLFDRSPLTDPSLRPRFGSQEHREVAREAVRQSLVLLKNERSVLPLGKTSTRIHVAGRNADDIGNQCGGWTIDWQGRSGNITPGTTILQAVKETVSPGTAVTFSLDGSGAAGADVGIVVIGETPYAEGPGDDTDLSLSAADVAAVDRMRQAGIPVVVILVSGRPMLLGPILETADAIIAAWLPGTEGQGVADVLFGDYNPTGKLPYSWPRTMQQIPINVADQPYDPLFPYGHGLPYEN